MENNIHNFHKALPPSSEDNKYGRLFFILAISTALIGGELLWSQIRNTNLDIDAYSANIYAATTNRESLDIAKLSAEVESVEIFDIEKDFEEVDRAIDSL